MSVRPGVLALLMVAAVQMPARAQRVVDPGGVATTLITLSPPEGPASDSVAYRVEMEDVFRLFARPAGTVPVLRDLIRLPLTFGVAPAAPAGTMEAGRVVATWSGGAESVHPITVQVRARYELRFWIGTDAATAVPGGEPAEVGYRLGNRGNAVDTVDIRVSAPDGWSVHASPERVVLAAGDTAVGTVQLVPADAEGPGAERVVAIDARGRRTRESRSVRVLVIGETNWFGDLASVPSTVFLGSSTGTDGLGGVAVRANGEIRPGTRISLDYRYTDQQGTAPAFRQELTGPRFRLGLEHAGWRLRAGEVYTFSDLFTGPSVHATGLDATWSGTTTGAGLFVARPVDGPGDENGHVVRASGELRTGLGHFTATVSDLRRDAGFFEGFGLRSAGVRYRTGNADHRLTVQAGLMRVTADSSGSRTGPAAEAEYVLRADRGSLTARLRSVPATVPRTAAYGNEFLISGTAGIVGGLSAIGWGFVTSSPLLGVRQSGSTRGAVAGLRYFAAGSRTQVQLTGNIRESDAPYLGTAGARRTLLATLDAPMGPLVFELDGELGRIEAAVADTVTTDAPFRYLSGGMRWSAAGQWAWAGLSYRDAGTGAVTAIDLAGMLDIGPARVQGGFGGRLDAGSLGDAVSFWTGTTMEVHSNMAATLGIDYQPARTGDRWRLSLGVTRSFALPLPVRREPAAHGIVYEDRNGNRVRDEGEPLLPDITVRLGALRTATDEAGTFRFMDPVQGPLRLETAELPLGLMVPTDVYLPAAGYVEIPVVRTGALDLTLFLDRDNDGERDDREAAADGVVVSVIAADGRSRDVAADADGHVRLNALTPGSYTLRIHPPATRRTGGPPLERNVTIPPGDTIRLTTAVPLRQREIRMPGAPPPSPAHRTGAPAGAGTPGNLDARRALPTRRQRIHDVRVRGGHTRQPPVVDPHQHLTSPAGRHHRTGLHLPIRTVHPCVPLHHCRP